MKPHIVLLRALFVAILLFLFSVPNAFGSDGPIRIGFLGDFTSVSKAYTRNAFNVVQMVIVDFNAQGGLFGRPIEIVHRDGANDPELHYRYVNELAGEEKSGRFLNSILRRSAPPSPGRPRSGILWELESLTIRYRRLSPANPKHWW